MLSGRDVELVGVWDGAEPYCRQCMVKRMGVLFVQMLECGLRSLPEDWRAVWKEEQVDTFGWGRMLRWEANERALDKGHEEALEYGSKGDCEGLDCKAVDRGDGDWFCEACAATWCDGCGKRLDWSQGMQDAAEYAAAERGEDLPIWP